MEIFKMDGLLPILGKLHDGAMLVDQKMKISFANTAAHNIFGYKSPDLIGKNISILLPEKLRASHEGMVSGFFESPHSRVMNPSMRLEGVDMDGNPIPILISLDPVEIEGNSMVLVSIRDIQSIVKMETELFYARKMETIGKTAFGMIHDLKNILQVIDSSIYLAGKRSEEEAETYYKQITDQTAHANTMLVELLNYLQKGVPEPSRLSLNETLNNLRPILLTIIPKHTDFTLEEADEDYYVFSTSTVIDQILINLISNAVDAVESISKPQIKVKIKVDPQQSDKIQLMVTDNGCGMSDEVRESIFKTFFTTKGARGTGLGMANVYGAVLDMKGSIDIDSKVGQGTTFSITLPTVP